jgi:hypothetical protein
MNLHDQVIYRCIHAACARPLPRRVNFCPYCGTGQHDGVVKPAHVTPPAQAEYRAPAPAPAPAAAAVAAAAVAAPAPAPVAPPAVARAEPPAPAAPRTYTAAPPPRREPVRMRYWLIAFAALWALWLYARPSPRKIEARIESAMTASAECRFNEAQSTLIELRMTKATPEQLARLQAAINAAVPGCERKKQRIKAWDDTRAAVESALAAGEFSKAQTRLALFARRFGDDDDTRRLKDKIGEQRAAAAPAPLPVERVAPSPSDTAQSVRNLIDEAERALAAGNYKAASDKLETCTTMVDAGNRECAAFKVHADRMQREQARCLDSGHEWYADRCH